MKFNCKLSEQFWRILCLPIQRDRNFQRWLPSDRTCLKETLIIVEVEVLKLKWKIVFFFDKKHIKRTKTRVKIFSINLCVSMHALLMCPCHQFIFVVAMHFG